MTRSSQVEAAKNSEKKDGLSNVKGALGASAGAEVSVARAELEVRVCEERKTGLGARVEATMLPVLLPFLTT